MKCTPILEDLYLLCELPGFQRSLFAPVYCLNFEDRFLYPVRLSPDSFDETRKPLLWPSAFSNSGIAITAVRL